MSKRSLLYRSIGVALLAIMVALPACCQDESFTFAFKPPTPLSYIETLKSTEVRVNSPTEIQTEITTVSGKISVTKSPRGYKIVTNPDSISMTRNGKPVTNPAFGAMAKVAITYDIDSSGKMLAVKGFDKMFKAMDKEFKAIMSPEQYQNFSAALPDMETGAIAKEKATWAARTASFVGRTAKIGDVWVGDETADLPFGTIVYDSTMKIAEKVRKGTLDCLRITFSYSTDTEGMKKFMQEMMDKLAESMDPGEAPKVLEVKVTGSGERVVDPKTLLIYSETTDRTVTIVTESPKEGRQPLTIQEKREYTYQYPK